MTMDQLISVLVPITLVEMMVAVGLGVGEGVGVATAASGTSTPLNGLPPVITGGVDVLSHDRSPSVTSAVTT